MQRHTALVRRTPLKRATPLSRATKPVKARNQKRRPSDKAVAQREIVLTRAGGRCEFEVRLGFDVWMRCLAFDGLVGVRLQCAHVFRRRHCERSIYDPDIAILGCEEHHKRWDARLRDGLRLPPGAEERARAAINAAAKTPEGRLKEGERP